MNGRPKDTTFWQNPAAKSTTPKVINNYAPDSKLPNDPNNACDQAHRLYQLGANTINSGWAYATDEDHDTPNRVTLPDLMGEYNRLPNYSAQNGRHAAVNPLHAVFVIKVALDHLDPKAVAIQYLRLKFAYTSQTIRNAPIFFPNGSSFLNDFALLQLLRGYIINQRHKFTFMSQADHAAVADSDNKILSSYIFLAGSDVNLWKAVDAILCLNRTKPELDVPRRLVK